MMKNNPNLMFYDMNLNILQVILTTETTSLDFIASREQKSSNL